MYYTRKCLAGTDNEANKERYADNPLHNGDQKNQSVKSGTIAIEDGRAVKLNHPTTQAVTEDVVAQRGYLCLNG